MSTTDTQAWLERVSNEAAANATASEKPMAGLENDAANPVPGERTTEGKTVDDRKADLHVKSPQQLGVTDAPDPVANDENIATPTTDPSKTMSINGDKPAGTKTLTDSSVSTEEAHPNEPVIGGKMPEESKMDEDPRGTVEHDNKIHHEVKVNDKDVETVKRDGEVEVNPREEVGVKDNGPGTHEPQQNKVAQDQLEGSVKHADELKSKVAVEEHEKGTALGDPGLKETNVVDGSPLEDPAAQDPIDHKADLTSVSTEDAPEGADVPAVVEPQGEDVAAAVTEQIEATDVPAATPAATDVPVEEGSVPATAETAPQTELASAISEIVGDTTDPVNDSLQQMDAVANDITDMERTQTALENYHALLTRAAEKDGTIDPTVMQSVMIGLESFGEPVLLTKMPSVESFSDATGRWTVSQEALDGLKSKAALVGTGLKNALAKLWDMLKNLWVQLTSETVRYERANKALRGSIQKLSKENTEDFSFSNMAALCIESNFVGDNPNTISTTIKTLEKVGERFPSMLIKVVDAYESAVNAHQAGEKLTRDELHAMWAEAEQRFDFNQLGLKEVNDSKLKQFVAEADSSILAKSEHNRYFASPLMVGGAFLVGRIFDSSGDREKNLDNFKFLLLQAVNKDTPSSARAPSKNALLQINTQVDELISAIERMKDINSEQGPMYKRLDKLGKSQSERIDISSMAYSATVTYVNFQRELIKHSVGLLKALVKLQAAALKHHDADAKVDMSQAATA